MRKLLLSLVAILTGLTTYAAPKETTLWESDKAEGVSLDWVCNPTVAATACADFEEGGEIVVYINCLKKDSWNSMKVMMPDWANFSWGDATNVPTTTTVKSYTLAAEDIPLVKSKGFGMSGHDIAVTKITYRESEGPIDPTVLLKDPVVINEASGSIEFPYDIIAKAGAVVGGGILVEYQLLDPSTAYVNFLHQGVEPTDPNDEEAVNAAKYTWADFSDPKIVIDEVSTMDRTSLLVLTDQTLNEINSYSKNLIIQCGMVRVTKVQVLTPENMPDLPEMSLVALDKTELGLAVGATEKLVATIKPSTAKATWTTSDPAVATVDNEGNVTAVGGGKATITCQIEDGTKATCTVSVADFTFVWKDRQDGFAIYGDAADIEEYVSHSPRLYITPVPADAKVYATYEKAKNGEYDVYSYLSGSDNRSENSIQFVLNKPCEIEFTIYIGNHEIEKKFKVTAKAYEKPMVEISASSGNKIPYDQILAGSNYEMSAAIYPDDASVDPYYDNDFEWTSSDPTIATVKGSGYFNSKCTVTGLKSGTVTIYATIKADGLETLVGERELTFLGHGEKSYQFYFYNNRGGSWTGKYNVYVPGNDVFENITLNGDNVDMVINSGTTVSYIPKYTAGQSFTFKSTDPNIRITGIGASPESSTPALVTFGDKTTCTNGVSDKTYWSSDNEYGTEDVTFTVNEDKEVAGLVYWTVTMYRYDTPEVALSEAEISGAAGETKQLTLNLTNPDSDVVLPATTKWTSADPAIASVDEDGVVTFVSKGSTEITGEYNGAKAVCAVSVLGQTAIDSIGTDANNAAAEYFNLQGMRVDAANLTPGVYVVRKGNEVQKVVVK